MFSDYGLIARLVDMAGGIDGRKKLQKLVFILKHVGVPFTEDFRFHLYGPYSEALAAKVVEMVELGVLTEAKVETPNGFPTYRYALKPGHRTALLDPGAYRALDAYQDLIEELASMDARRLELLATLLYLRDHGYGVAQLPAKVRDLKAEQEFSDEEIHRAIDLMRQVLPAAEERSGT